MINIFSLLTDLVMPKKLYISIGGWDPVDTFNDVTFNAFKPVTDKVEDYLSTPDQPASPDYTGAAEATAAGNLEMAEYTTDVNRPDMYNPYGSSVWTQDGNNWANTVTMSPEQQALFDQQQSNQLLQGDLAGQGLAATGGMFADPYKTGLDPLQSYDDQRTSIVDAMMARTTEDVAEQRDAKASQLVAQGIPRQSPAFFKEMKAFDRQLTDARQQSELYATDQISTMTADDRATRNQGISEALLERQTPLNEYNALMSGTGVQNPAFNDFSQQQQILGPDYLGAETAKGAWDLAGWNAEIAGDNAITSGLFGLGGAAIMASDIRLKHNINRIGALPSGIPTYEFSYKGSEERQTGVMAQDVIKVIPEAVVTMNNGYYAVDYGKLR